MTVKPKIIEGGISMSYESFSEVFAPNADTVEGNWYKHHKAAKAYTGVAVFALLGVAACLCVIMRNCDFFAEVVMTIMPWLMLFEGAIALGAGAAAIYHLCKAEHFQNVLDTQYLLHRKWRSTNFYD